LNLQCRFVMATFILARASRESFNSDMPVLQRSGMRLNRRAGRQSIADPPKSEQNWTFPATFGARQKSFTRLTGCY
jgi:hypothetical protein